jgi:endonuclease/exonuclease/phosphatase family metal-dependent hydrolase
MFRSVFTFLFCLAGLHGQTVPVVGRSNVTFRIVAANLTGNSQRYEDPAIRIFRGLKPDVVAINEFNFRNNSASDFRFMVTNTFGPEFSFYREPSGSIPNGVISRWPITAAGSWDDPSLGDRGFAWARIDLPGPHDLFVVSVHLKAGGSGSDESTRRAQVTLLRSTIAAQAPAGAYIVLAGDLNIQDAGERTSLIGLFNGIVRDTPIPTDQSGDPDTNANRNRPYDLVLQSPSLTTNHVAARIGSQSFANGLVFDSRRFQPLSDVAPVLAGDSGTAQHMAVLKDFQIGFAVTNFIAIAPPRLAWDLGTIRWTAPAGIAWRLEASTDLVTWAPAGGVSSSGTNYSASPSLPAVGGQFFRVRVP